MEDQIMSAIKDIQFVMFASFLITLGAILTLLISIEGKINQLKKLIEKKAGTEKE